jgi:YVTN family beta-propeller protein
VARIALGKSPEAIYLSIDGKLLAAAVEENDQVVIVDTGTLKVARTVRMKGKNPEHAVFSPDGRWLYASAEEADSVDIVDVAQGTVVKSLKVGERPRGIGFLPDASVST